MAYNSSAGNGSGADPLTEQISLILAIVAIFGCWPAIQLQIPQGSRFEMADLVAEHWMHRRTLEPWVSVRWAWLAAHNYHGWFAISTLPGAIAIGLVQAFDKRSVLPFVHAGLGWGGGGLLGYVLFLDFREYSWPLAVMMPATLGFLGGAIGSRMTSLARKPKHLRGTRLGIGWSGRLLQHLWRRRSDVALAGITLSRVDEAMHVAAIGATGSGKSTALRALMADSLRRGDRHLVADPDGAAMEAHWAAGDIVLNPFDPRCAKWDLLGEIERPSDFAFIAGSLLPHMGQGDHDQWISYAQQLLAGAMENFWTLKLGSSDDFVTMLSSAPIRELRNLCAGTPAARYFEDGGERMLASILGTLAPAVGHLRLIAERGGEPFSVRRWIREGQGSLWIPYQANQIAALRGLASCWMNIAILETLSLEPSSERRIWFQIDELDALGRIEGLKDGLARLRKFGGCIAIGFQSYAQLRQIYGDGAEAIVENIGNFLLLRSGLSDDGGTAKLASRLIGSREVERQDISRSRSWGRYTSRSMTTQPRRVVEEVVLPSEIMQLPDREGFLKRAGSPVWRRVRFPYSMN
ncbi:type IV secretion system DNA-binding domain-containing protein [Sphingopyxis sp. YR583]|uniref:type IV secretion system DNA-binding domain-containing protein n=1 Tax=Sphingopyxis sp. YR583 TaxID=1881047 RepID=UPI00210B3552|nr:type IV secretion system DNA-binding domain-containing protein [Sphingopyxis sp. YR583]